MENYFGKNIKFIRESKKLSKNKFSEIIGVNQSTIGRWEDENRIPTVDTALDVSIALDIPLTELVGIDLSKQGLSSIKENKTFDLINSLPDDKKKMVIAVIKAANDEKKD